MTDGQFWFVMFCLVALLDLLAWKKRRTLDVEARAYWRERDEESRRRHDEFMAGLTPLVVCESSVAITTHVREVTPDHPVKLGGHPRPRPRALCGVEVAWDCRLPVGTERCVRCAELRERNRES
ncbi:MAG: hypothetical protein ACTHU0_02700 [Kofleriaceae bacterium]